MLDAPQPSRRYRFGVFEADTLTGELRRKGIRIKLHSQPFQLLTLLLERNGELLTREEICRVLWPDGTFVDYEHGVNSAINRIREVLGDSASNPRFIETLARRGYRFIAPISVLSTVATATPSPIEEEPQIEEQKLLTPLLATPEELPQGAHRSAQICFCLMQLMYMGFYGGALANLAEIEELFAPLARPLLALNALIVTAAILIPVRAFLLTTVLIRAPRFRRNYLLLWGFLLPLDVLWALAPFLLLHHINVGLALSCTALLVYAPFAQRSLVLMGAGERADTALKAPKQG